MDKLDLTTPNFTNENIAKLAELFPNCVTEKKNDKGGLEYVIDFDALRQEFSETIVEGQQERYSLNWPGKREALVTANTPISKTLRPCRDESVDFDNTKNIFIEGDNLDALKLLQETYLNKIKMIYIDPPYNTGNDFIYNDNFTADKDEYDDASGQRDEEGGRLVSNPESNGRYHSDWLSMIYPRLKLARNLLRDDGVIFISIDDNEIHNLRKICDEVFGEENFVNQISVKAKPSSGASGGGEDIKLKKNIEYLLCYCKSKNDFPRFNNVYDDRDLVGYIREYKESGKSWKYTRVLTSLGDKNFYSEIKDGSGKPIKIFKHDNVKMQTLSELSKKENLSEKDVYLKYFERIFRDTNAQSSIRQRVLDATDNEDTFYSIEYVPASGRNKDKITTLYYKGRNKDLIAWLSDVATKTRDGIIKRDKVGTLWDSFNWNNVSKEGDIQYPNGKKPISFIQRMICLCSNSKMDDLILDFFAGSASVAHAVIDQNYKDAGQRASISIQLPETISVKDKNKYYSAEEFQYLETVCDIGKERIRRAGNKIKEDNADKEGVENLDIGFRVFKIDSSNMVDVTLSPDEAHPDMFEEQVGNIKQDRSSEDLLFQVLLDWGVDLSLQINREDIDGKEIFFVDDNALAACFDEDINEDFVKKLAEKQPLRVVFRDDGFASDAVKINIEQIFKLKSPTTDIKVI